MSFFHQLTRPLREHATSFVLSNTANRSSAHLGVSAPLAKGCFGTLMGKRWASNMEIEDLKVFQQQLDTKSPVLAYFYKPRCQFCRIFESTLSEALKVEPRKVDLLLKINVDQGGRTIAEKYGVDAVPTVVGFRKGRETNKIIGNVKEEDVRKMLDKI